MRIYIKGMFVFLWLAVSCCYGLILSLLCYGNPSINFYFTRFFAWGATRIVGVRIITEGSENSESFQPCIYVANHQSNFDAITYGSISVHRTVIIGKKELFWMPFFGLYFVAAGNILIDRNRKSQAVAGLTKATDAIRKRRISIWIFPEGTRNKGPDPLLPFKKGAFHMAIRAQVPVVPIVSAPLKPILGQIRKGGGRVDLRVRFLPPIPTLGMNDKDVDRLSVEVKEKMLEAFRGLSIPPIS